MIRHGRQFDFSAEHGHCQTDDLPRKYAKISHKGDGIAFMTTERQAADARTGIRLRSGMAVLNINSLIINRIA